MSKKSDVREDRLLLKLRSGELSPTQRFCDVCPHHEQFGLDVLFEKTNPMIAGKFYDIALALKDAEEIEGMIGDGTLRKLPEKSYYDAADEIESARKAFDDFERMPIVEIYATLLGVPGLKELQKAIIAGRKKDQVENQPKHNATSGITEEFLNGKFKELKTGIAAVGAEARAGRTAAEGAKEAADATCQNVNDGFDSVCKTVGEKFQRVAMTPPRLSELTIDDALEIYEKMMSVKGIDNPHKSSRALATFIERSTITIRGWNLKDMNADADGLRALKHRCKVHLKRNPSPQQ